MATNTASHPLSIMVGTVNEIAISGPSVNLALASGSAGVDEISLSSTELVTLSFTTNASSAKKITAAIDNNLPKGITLFVAVALDGNGSKTNGDKKGVTATSEGTVALSKTPSTIISNVNKAIIRGAPITYTLKAQASAGSLSSIPLTVTYTITNA